MNKKIIGYTTGVFDLFHVGHLNILRQAKARCDYLIVGVCTDELTHRLKGKWPVVPYEQRARIVEALRYVDEVVPETSADKLAAWERLGYDVLFKGGDAREKPAYKEFEKELAKHGAYIQYFPYTDGVSSSLFRVEKDGNMKVDKEKCMSLYLAFRYIGDPDVQFAPGIVHRDHQIFPYSKRRAVRSAEDIDRALREVLATVDLSKTGICLSAGMDSAILASYLPKGTKAYTARCVAASAIDETVQAHKYCELYGLEHVVVDVTWDDYVRSMDELAVLDGSPIVPNEPQAYMLARRMAADGITTVIFGNAADDEFGGMDRLLSKDWTFDEWVERFTFLDAKKVLKNPVDVSYVYEPYRSGQNGIDFIKFIKEIYSISAGAAYTSGYSASGLQYLDPYEHVKLDAPLNLARIRAGESKYLLRELFKMRYPGLEVPEKLPMSRPADEWLKGWQGPERPEFIPGCVACLSGEQKLLVYSLERFLNLLDRRERA